MRHNIFSYSQEVAVKLGLTLPDLLILQWMADFFPTSKVVKHKVGKYERRGLTAEGAGREYWRVPYHDCIYRMYGEDDSRAWARFVIDTAVNK